MAFVSTPESRAKNNEASRRYRLRNPEKRRQSANAWAKRNVKTGMARFVERYHADPAFNLAIKTRRRIHMALRKKFFKGYAKDSNINLLGCSYNELKIHIESKFKPGMTWDDCFNGKIHIDHILPMSSFNLLDPEQLAEACHYTNLQPLWATVNIRKGAKLDYRVAV